MHHPVGLGVVGCGEAGHRLLLAASAVRDFVTMQADLCGHMGKLDGAATGDLGGGDLSQISGRHGADRQVDRWNSLEPCRQRRRTRRTGGPTPDQ
jgi:hypothetical protein